MTMPDGMRSSKRLWKANEMLDLVECRSGAERIPVCRTIGRGVRTGRRKDWSRSGRLLVFLRNCNAKEDDKRAEAHHAEN
jgi:hypothetical protein